MLLSVDQDAKADVLPLLARVEPIPGESLMSLISRACVENVFGRPRDIFAFAGAARQRAGFGPFDSLLPIASLAKLLGVPESEVRTRMHPKVKTETAFTIDWYGTPLERRFVEASVRRVAPRAMLHSSHHRASWMLRPLVYCPESLEFLLSNCPKCQHSLGWAHTVGIERCERCLKLLVKGSGPRLPERHVNSYRLLASLVSTDPGERAAALGQFPPPFDAWTPGEVFNAVFELAAAWSYAGSNRDRRAVIRLHDSSSLHLTARELHRAVETIQSWPIGLVPLLQSLWARADPRHLGLADWLGPLGRFFRPDASAAPIAVLLRADIGGIAQAANLPVKSTPRLAPPPDQITEKEAVARYGVSKGTLRRLDRGGSTLRARRRNVTKRYDRKGLDDAITAVRGCITATKCEQTLGIPRYCISALAAAGLLRAETCGDALLLAGKPVLYRKAEVAHLKAQLGSARDQPRDYVTLKRAMRYVFAPSAWLSVIGGIASGRIEAVRVSQAGPLADHLFVDPFQIDEVLEHTDLSEFDGALTVTAMTAGRVLDMSDVIVCKALHAGLIEGEAHCRRHDLALRSVAEFAQDFVRTRELIQRTGKSGDFICRTLDTQGIGAAAIAHNATLWSRAKAERALSLPPLRALGSIVSRREVTP